MIRFDRVSVTYPDAPSPTIAGVDLDIAEGEFCLVVGRTGSGKSTLLGCVNGLVPRFTGGLLRGSVTVAGRSTADHAPRDLADVVGYVGQSPSAGFVTDVVEDELAYVMENLGVPPEVMRRRVEDVLDLMGLAALRRRPLVTLSGGQRQRVAIGSVLTTSPKVLVLDEPTSALDPAAAEEVLSALVRLVHDVGVTVVIAEHRLERVIQYADRVVIVGCDPDDGNATVTARIGDPVEMMDISPVAPPVVRLGRLLGWEPLALSVRDARRAASEVRDHLGRVGSGRLGAPVSEPGARTGAVRTRALGVDYGSVTALRDVEISVDAGQVVAVMGRNGSGKSTLLSALAGLRAPSRGDVEMMGRDPARLSPAEVIRIVGMVPQDPGMLLYHDSVGAECRGVDHDAGLEPGTTRAVLDSVLPGLDDGVHPHDLSEGQRLGLALAVVLAPSPPVLLLDEPTRGLDYDAKERLVEVLRRLADDGCAVVLATHDVEVVASVADRVVVLAEGEVVSDGPARDVVVHSPVFAPQVAKIMAPVPLLTVAEVDRLLGQDPLLESL